MEKETRIEIRKKYPGFELDARLDIEKGKVYVLAGPSGSGKTTIANVLCGIEKEDSGSFVIGGTDLFSLPVEKRRIGMVFQERHLFPHMNVIENVRFAAKCAGFGEDKMKWAIEMSKISGLENRNVGTLSGGEKQRVAIARAIVSDPQILILDEPLKELDAPVKLELRKFLAELQNELKPTTIYITHDLAETASFAHRIGIINNGRIEQEGSLKEIALRPKNSFVKNFIAPYILAEKD